MAFIRRRMYPEELRKGRWKAAPRYQLVETYREGGKVRQRLAGMGEHPTVEEALHAFRADVARLEMALERNKHPQGWRAFRRRHQRQAELETNLKKSRARLARLEAVVSRTSNQIDVVDTTASEAA